MCHMITRLTNSSYKYEKSDGKIIPGNTYNIGGHLA